MAASENRTQPTDVPVADFLDRVAEGCHADAEQAMEVMHRLTGAEPVMWGPSIIGYGTRHYVTDAGREGDVPLLSLSPRKANLVVYVPEGLADYGYLLERLGPHRTGVSCLYLPRLTKVDVEVLAEIVARSHGAHAPADDEAADAGRTGSLARVPLETVADYLASVPLEARPIVDELRGIVREVAPDAVEVVSYGLIGYRIGNCKACRIYVSGWKDHGAVYPVPHDDGLEAELEPYRHGKGALWFPLDEPLPRDLLVRTAAFMMRP